MTQSYLQKAAHRTSTHKDFNDEEMANLKDMLTRLQ